MQTTLTSLLFSPPIDVEPSQPPAKGGFGSGFSHWRQVVTKTFYCWLSQQANATPKAWKFVANPKLERAGLKPNDRITKNYKKKKKN